MDKSYDGAGRPRLLLHICCAGCSPHIIGMMNETYNITGYFYNPNIHPEEEHRLRLEEARGLARQLDIPFLSDEYDDEIWFALTEDQKDEPEGGARCRTCFQVRLDRAATRAAKGGFDAFTTTLTVSPHKNAALINAIGQTAGQKYGVRFLQENFKKKNGFVKTTSLSNKLGLYRQDYCGCVYSRRERLKTD